MGTDISRMMLTAGHLFLLSLTSLALGAPEEPPYTVIQEHDGFWEERLYPAAKWVSIKEYVPNHPHDGPEHDAAYQSLFNYFDGDNMEDLIIPMTSPVSMHVIYEEGITMFNYTMSLLIPAELQEGAPEPNDSLLYLEERPEMTVAAFPFEGLCNDYEYAWAELALGIALVEEGFIDYDDYDAVSNFWSADYSGPSVIENKRCEIWMNI